MEQRRPASGKEIEELVATIEGLLLPRGFTVTKNTRVHNDHGVQVAEFDVEIRGKLGSADIAWLMECRNRPREGPAPGAWIEQLMGRRDRFNFNKVTAVSTTGFTEGAIDYAAQKGIDLRQIDQVGPELVTWLGLRSMQTRETRHFLTHARLIIDDNESPERAEAAQALLIKEKPADLRILRSTQTGATVTVLDAFINVVAEHPSPLASVRPNQDPMSVRINAEYRDDSHFVVDTHLGPVRITRIDFEGTLAIVESEIALGQVSEYRAHGSDQPISQTAGFTVPLQGSSIILELHRLTQSGDTVVTVRRFDTAQTAPNPEPPQ
jgi:hypothetical protein